MNPILVTARAVLLQGDSLDLLDALAPDSIDSCVTDPPAGIEFMGKEWDKFKATSESSENASGPQTDAWHEGGTNPYARGATPRYRGKANADLLAFQDFIAAVFEKVLRVLKPGGHALVWAIPRTAHHTGMGLERAGFEIRDVVSHLFGTGFPKSLDVSKAIDATSAVPPFTADLVKQWAGWGTALKPGAEFWFLARKPLDGTVAQNVTAHGTGGLNIDGCRIGSAGGGTHCSNRDEQGNCKGHENAGRSTSGQTFHGPESEGGRWPANVVLSHTDECIPVGERKVKANGSTTGAEPSSSSATLHGNALPRPEWQAHGNGDGTETVEAWACPVSCPVRQLDKQSGFSKSPGKTGRGAGGQHGRYGPIAAQGTVACPSDSGGASRFFYVAKPGRKERDLGCEALPPKTGGEATEREDGSAGLESPRAGAGRRGGARNHHPTVKSVELMRWLCRLITPPGGRVLDPFAGSGSTVVAALAEGFQVVGFERDAEYVPIIRARSERALKDYPAVPEVKP